MRTIKQVRSINPKKPNSRATTSKTSITFDRIMTFDNQGDTVDALTLSYSAPDTNGGERVFSTAFTIEETREILALAQEIIALHGERKAVLLKYELGNGTNIPSLV